MTLALQLFPLFLICVGLFAYRRLSGLRFLDCIVLLPWIGYLITEEALLPILGFQICAIFYAGLWARHADRPQTEAVTKLSLAILFGVFLVSSAYLLFQYPHPYLLWPFDSLVKSEWYEALGASLFSTGIILLLGLPPLQQGWLDLSESGGSSQQFRSQFLLRSSLYFVLWSFLPVLNQVLSFPLLKLLAGVGIVGLFLGRLVEGVQMSVFRSFAYQASASVMSLFVVISCPQEFRDTYHLDVLGLIVSAFGLFFWVLSQKSIGDGKNRLHWDDHHVPARLLTHMKRLIIWDLVQVALAILCLAAASQYVILIVVCLYGLSSLSLLLDPAAFRARAR